MPEPAKSLKKRNKWINPKSSEKLSFSATEEINRLERVQKVNQKVVLSFYGYKIDLPCRFFDTTGPINLMKYTAIIPEASHEAIESYKLEIRHKLGTTHCRLDVPKEKTASQLTADAFQLADLNIRSKREFEDYLIQRKQYDLDFSAMDLGHRQARLNRKYEKIARGIDVAMGAVGFVASTVTGVGLATNLVKSSSQATERLFQTAKADLLSKLPAQQSGLVLYGAKGTRGFDGLSYSISVPRVPISGKGKRMLGASAVGAFGSASKLASGIAGLMAVNERATLEEEGFGIQIRDKALESYQIDLGFERQKDDQLFTMRRLFGNESYNEITDRQRQKALDTYESPVVQDIYLEVWTVSSDQKKYVENFHEKFGVDCRVARKKIDNPIYFRDEIDLGIYCIEDVEIENLADRVELEFLKARLTGGIKFIKWEEAENVKELTPVDKRILEIQSEFDKYKLQTQEKEERCSQQISELTTNNERINSQLNTLSEQHHQLSESYRKQEAQLTEKANLATLYKNEAEHLKQDLFKESQKHSQEKEEHSGTKQEVENLTQQKTMLEEQVKEQRLQLTQKDQQISSLNEQLAASKREAATAREQGTCKVPINKIPAKYILVACGENYQRNVLCKFDTLKQVWVKDVYQTLVADKNAKQVKSQSVGARVTSPNVRVNLSVYREALRDNYEWMAPNLGPSSAQVDNGIPFFEKVPNSLEEKVGCERWFKDGTWSHKEIQGGKKITNYKEYLEAMQLTLDNPSNWRRAKAIPICESLTKEVVELRSSLQAVREIEQSLKERLRNQQMPDIWKQKGFREILKPSTYVLTNCSDEDLYWCKFDEDTFAWVVTDEVELRGSSNQRFLRANVKDKTENDWFYHNQSGQFSGMLITKYKDYKTKMLEDKKNRWSFQGNVAIRDYTYTGGVGDKLPFFRTKPKSKADLLVCEVHFSNGTWTGRNEGTRVTNYGEYLDALGMDFVENKVVTKKQPMED